MPTIEELEQQIAEMQQTIDHLTDVNAAYQQQLQQGWDSLVAQIQQDLADRDAELAAERARLGRIRTALQPIITDAAWTNTLERARTYIADLVQTEMPVSR